MAYCVKRLIQPYSVKRLIASQAAYSVKGLSRLRKRFFNLITLPPSPTFSYSLTPSLHTPPPAPSRPPRPSPPHARPPSLNPISLRCRRTTSSSAFSTSATPPRAPSPSTAARASDAPARTRARTRARRRTESALGSLPRRTRSVRAAPRRHSQRTAARPPATVHRSPSPLGDPSIPRLTVADTSPVTACSEDPCDSRL